MTMNHIHAAKVPDGLCYQSKSEVLAAAGDISDLKMLLEVRGYWVILTKQTLFEAIADIDRVESERLAALLPDEDESEQEVPAEPVKPAKKEAKHGKAE